MSLQNCYEKTGLIEFADKTSEVFTKTINLESPNPAHIGVDASGTVQSEGNSNLEYTVNGVVEHENNADVDQMPKAPGSSRNEPPKPSITEEVNEMKLLELREQDFTKKEGIEKEKDERGRKFGLPPEDLATAVKLSVPLVEDKKGKKVKKKAARSALKEKEKEKRVSTSSSKIVSQEENASSVIADDGSVMEKEKKVCAHLEKGVNLRIVSSKIESAESTGCEYCKEGVNDRKVSKGKGKHGKKKGASDSRAKGKATWICLQCGHFSCGGVGLPTSPQSHALRHVRQTRHPLVIQMENPHLRWCFSCSTLLPVNKMENTGEEKDVFLDIVKLLKKRTSKVPSIDVEDVWFGSGSGSGSRSGSVLSEVKAESKTVTVANGKGSYAVRGLVNLGNTCFFNSVMQNLLAMDLLQEYFLNLEASTGPLTSALKKIFVEACSESGLRNVINPKSLFGCVCAKAPQFRGYQQQDSHELLRYLLDGLSAEDLYAKKSAVPATATATFVDNFFGGQTSSTVCCVECGHSSVVYEPFLDLSLPLPTKKPPSKKAQPVSRAKKTKPPPKRGGRSRPKLNNNGDLRPAVSGNTSTRVKSFSGVKDDVEPAANGFNTSTTTESSSSMKGDSLSCALSVDLAGPSNSVHRNVLVTQDSSSTKTDYASDHVSHCAAQDDSWLAYLEPTSQGQGIQDVDSFAWLDYLEPDDSNLVVEDEEFSVTQGLGSLDRNHESDSMQDAAKSSVEASLSKVSEIMGDNQEAFSVPDAAISSGEVSVHPEDMNPKAESTVDDWGNERPVMVQDNEILLLTYKEDGPMEGKGKKIDADISSSSVVDGEDTLGFVGLGDLFNDPEDIQSETGVSNILVSESLGNGFLAGSNTESDPDEVDDTDSPVSVERCLAHFIKPELLSGEHAWHCENCSKLLKEERQKVRKNQKKAELVQRKMHSDVCSSSEVLQAKRHPCIDSSAVVLGTHNNGSTVTDENLKKFEARRTDRFGPNSPREEEERHVGETAHVPASGSGVCFGPSDETNLVKSADSHVVFNDHVPVERPCGLSKVHELGEDEEEIVDLKCVKVMRDATKRILISKTPPILTIHLKRFGQDARGRFSKLNGHVVFKEFLDLGPYMDRRSTEKDKCIYRLVGVVEHSGSMRGGHYVAYVRTGDRLRGRSEEESRQGHSVWYHASDAQVREATLEEVLGCEAYLLFYEEVKL